jgi:hypothetical protein
MFSVLNVFGPITVQCVVAENQEQYQTHDRIIRLCGYLTEWSAAEHGPPGQSCNARWLALLIGYLLLAPCYEAEYGVCNS